MHKRAGSIMTVTLSCVAALSVAMTWPGAAAGSGAVDDQRALAARRARQHDQAPVFPSFELDFDRGQLPADVVVPDEHGHLHDGVRCATRPVDAREKALVRAALITASVARPGQRQEPIEIPVAFHVIVRSRRGELQGDVGDDRIEEQIDILNEAYAGHGFSFRLESVDRTDNKRFFKRCHKRRVERKMKQKLAVDPATTLNIYSCAPKGGLLGWAYMPWSFREDDPRHGVVVLHSTLPAGAAMPYNLGDTTTHEVGHYLGLEHTFEGGCGPVGDEVDDTPAEQRPAYGCPRGRDTCPAAEGIDPVENFMDYSDDACMDRFTAGQAERMQEIVATWRTGLGGG